MLSVDTSFLVDYLNGAPEAGEWLSAHESEPIHAPTVALFEVYRGALRADLPGGLERTAEALSWIEPMPFTDAAARETAHVEAELRAAGEQINFADRQIAGVAREAGSTLVTADAHFERVDGLDVEFYTEE
jgi:predicted nucleic acid-binding protein